MLLFITESTHTIFSSIQKANLLELLENPSQTKEDLLYPFVNGFWKMFSVRSGMM
jgi:hypothetical protein